MSYDKVKQAKHLSVGIKQTLKAIEHGSAREIIVAKDADKKLINKLTQTCSDNNVAISFVDSMKKLGKVCGIDVGASAVALLKD